jgi:hypothetical protein
VIHIQDVDAESYRSYRGHGANGGSTDANLAPGQVVVDAAVLLRFAIRG